MFEKTLDELRQSMQTVLARCPEEDLAAQRLYDMYCGHPIVQGKFSAGCPVLLEPFPVRALTFKGTVAGTQCEFSVTL